MRLQGDKGKLFLDVQIHRQPAYIPIHPATMGPMHGPALVLSISFENEGSSDLTDKSVTENNAMGAPRSSMAQISARLYEV